MSAPLLPRCFRLTRSNNLASSLSLTPFYPSPLIGPKHHKAQLCFIYTYTFSLSPSLSSPLPSFSSHKKSSSHTSSSTHTHTHTHTHIPAYPGGLSNDIIHSRQIYNKPSSFICHTKPPLYTCLTSRSNDRHIEEHTHTHTDTHRERHIHTYTQSHARWHYCPAFSHLLRITNFFAMCIIIYIHTHTHTHTARTSGLRRQTHTHTLGRASIYPIAVHRVNHTHTHTHTHRPPR
jgi:hypothetical protein